MHKMINGLRGVGGWDGIQLVNGMSTNDTKGHERKELR